MNNRKKEHYRCRLQRMIVPWMVLLLLGTAQNVSAQNEPKKVPARSDRYTNLPSGYTQVGTTQLYYKQNSNAIDMIGYYNGYYYSSTYGDYGYKLSVQVGNNSATRVDCFNGTTIGGVTVQPSVEQQGELARICYTVTNANDADVVISLGTHADVMIGRNDSAPIERRIDTFGQTYGLTMKDGQGAQLCVLFGSGLAGVTAVSDFWFGKWSANSDPYNMVGNYNTAGNWMVENGSYDSGMGWCWKDRTITAGSTVVFSYVIGVGEVNLEPNSTFEVTPDDPEGWNDLSRPHRLTLNGLYESPAGLDGIIDYAVEDSEEWIALTDTLASGDEFTGSLVAMFDATKSTHVIKFRTRDLVGNTTLLHPIEYKDVSFHSLTGIEEKTYTGDSLYQTNITCDLDTSEYVLKHFRNNVNAGTASFNIEGVFPYTIGRKTYTFNVNPQPLTGELQLSEMSFVYNAHPFTPDWQFSNANYANLEYDKDYTLYWSNNIYPGTGTLTVSGKNNYTGSLSVDISIDKASLTDNLFTLNLPNEDITYDEQSHGASVSKMEGVGEAIITYQKDGEEEMTTAQPVEAGDYTVYLEFADGPFYYGRPVEQIGSFSIYQFNAEEWAILQTVLPQLTEMGWSQPWDTSQGIKSVSAIQGLNIEKGHVIGFDLANQNLTGTFPYAILAFPQLQCIDLANNKLSGDIGAATYVFAQQHPEQMTNIKILNISGNQLTGNISLLANSFPSLTSLNASENCLEEVYPVISPSVTELDLSKQTIARVVPLQLDKFSADSIATKIPSILLYDHTNQTYTPDINLLFTAMDSAWSAVIACKDGQISVPYVSEQNAYYGASGDTLDASVLNEYYNYEGSTFRICLSFETGDGNFDGQVNVLDLQANILYIMENYLTRPYNFTAANLWNDEKINVQDIICLVNVLMNAETDSDQNANVRRKTLGDVALSDASVYVQDGKLMLETLRPVAALDLHLNGAKSLNVADELERMGMTFVTKEQEDGLHVIAYAMNGACIPSGTSIIGTVDSDVAIVEYAMLADREANAIPVAFSGISTGVDYMNPSASEENAIYDLLGRKIQAIPHKGIYIKKGQKVVK